MQVFLYAIGDLAIETALNVLNHSNVIKIIARGIVRCQITMMGD